ncbi:DUF3656 domain-containing protein [Bacillota bacterium LX-D]|nr:DUF3656 domain-containing protein [Bacillota bacterium LX-D]
MNDKIELLGPAGSKEAFIAAIQNGADAVYLGGKSFSARHYAANFDDKELEWAVQYAHRQNKLVYVTLNTLLRDDELEQAATYLNFLYGIGIDAVIVQDLGLVKLIRDLFPNLKIHASTQMTIHNAAGVKFLEELEIKRVVLAREVNLNDIEAIKKIANVELEIFVHGALCISYSGQCLMSSMIGGRSGNRGKCAQPCRMKYQLIKGKKQIASEQGEYLLSPQDLNTILYLPQILSSGVTSLKLEGRMKRPEYVATVIRIYRQAIDRFLQNPANFEVTAQELRELTQIFNRDFTTGYFLANQGSDLMSYKRPNNRGLFLGRILETNVQEHKAKIKLEEPVAIGDGIEIWVSKGGRKGLTLQKIWVGGKKVTEAQAGQEITIEIADKVKAGDRIFKTHDAKLMAKAQESYQNPNAEKKIPLKVLVDVKEGHPLSLTMEDDEGNKVTGRTSFITEKALKRPLTEDYLWQQLDRLGNTPYCLGEFFCKIEGNVMVPASEINNVRRSLVTELEQKRQQKVSNQPIDSVVIKDYFNQRSYKHQSQGFMLSVAVRNFDSALAAIEGGAQRVYMFHTPFRSRALSKANLDDVLVEAAKNNCSLVLALPRIWHEHEAVKINQLITYYTNKGIDGFLASNLGSLKILIDSRIRNNIYADYPLNIFNNLTIKQLQEIENICLLCLSPELNFKQIKELNAKIEAPVECIVHGSLPLMISEYCAVGSLVGGKNAANPCSKPCLNEKYALRDRLNIEFPLEMDESCRMHIYNSKELCLIDDLPHFTEIGIFNYRIEALGNEPKNIKQITSIYRQSLTALDSGLKDKDKLVHYKEMLAANSNTGFTKGHYYRGVL